MYWFDSVIIHCSEVDALRVERGEETTEMGIGVIGGLQDK